MDIDSTVSIDNRHDIGFDYSGRHYYVELKTSRVGHEPNWRFRKALDDLGMPTRPNNNEHKADM